MTGTDVVVHGSTGPSSGALALRSDQDTWNDTQRAALAQIGVAKAPPADQQVLLHVSQRTGLDPFSRQIYMIERGGKWTIQTGIDGFRIIAERHPEYAGQLEPEWCGTDGVWKSVWAGAKPPHAARVGVLRRDWPQPVYATVIYSEFTAGNSMWRTKPAHMIAKVAEASALRKAFPQDLSGLYTDDEMQHVDRHGRQQYDHRDAGRAVTTAELTGQTPPAPASAAGEEGTAAPAVGSHAAPPSDQPPATDAQRRRVGALFGEGKVAEQDRHLLTAELAGRPIASWSELTVADANRVIERLEQLRRSGHEHGLPGEVEDLLNLAEQRRMEAEENGAVAESDAAAEAEDQAVADEAAAEQS